MSRGLSGKRCLKCPSQKRKKPCRGGKEAKQRVIVNAAGEKEPLIATGKKIKRLDVLESSVIKVVLLVVTSFQIRRRGCSQS